MLTGKQRHHLVDMDVRTHDARPVRAGQQSFKVVPEGLDGLGDLNVDPCSRAPSAASAASPRQVGDSLKQR